MDTSKAKYSGSKIVPHSDFRVGTAQEDLIMKSKRKRKRIGTWNVNTLLQAGKIENLKIEMRRMKLDILGISEMRWRGTGDFWSDEDRVIYSGTEEGERTGQKGVGIILEKALGLRVLGYVQHSDRIILVKINTKPNNTVIIQIYMPTTNADDDEIEKIYEDINKLIDQTKAEDNVIVMGDVNATVGEGKEGAIVGQFGLGTRNDRGRRLIEFCTRNDFIITNTHFQHHKRQRYTWKAPGDIRRAQIDYIMVKNRFKNQVKNSKSYPGADIGSDHNLVMMKCELKFKKLEKKNANRIDSSKLKIPDIKVDFENNTNKLVEEHKEMENKPIEEQWVNLKKIILETGTKILLKGKEGGRKPWISQEVIDLINKRRKFKNAVDEEGRKEYRKLRNEIIRRSKKEKEEYLNEICEEINRELIVNNLDKAYGMVKKFFGEGKKKASIIKDEKELLYEEKQIVNRWKEYLQKLYGDEPMSENIMNVNEEQIKDNIGEDILRGEFDKAMEELKNNKAPGIDEIPAELLKNCGEKAKDVLFKIISSMYKTGQIPSDFTKCLIIPIPKKARAQTCEQYRTLSLISHASKVLTRIIMRRIETKIDGILTDDQFGFRRGMGTREAILSLRQVIDKMNRKGKTTFIAFVDLEKAFDNVNWDIIFDTLKKTGASYRDTRIIHSLYKNEIGVIKSGANKEEVRIMKGVRQGCSLSPYLFNLYVQEAINKIREKGGVGINIHGEKIDMLRFADDIAVLAENENDLQNTLNIMNDTMRDEFKMKINIKKTKILISSRREEERLRTTNITIDNESLQQVQEYKYLGSLITAEGTSKKEIVSRINQAKCTFNKKKSLFTSRSIDISIRKNLIKTYVWSVMLYGSETWTIAKAEENRLLAFEAWYWRRMQGLS